MKPNGAVAAVVPVFNPDPGVMPNLVRLAAQVSRVIVIDDTGSGSSQLDERLPGNVTLVPNDENVGQARCLNSGIRLAMAEGFERIMTFDQDTEVPDHYVARLTEHLDKVQSTDPGALVAGPDRDAERGHVWTGGWCSLSLAQSGLLFDTRVFARVGMFREEFFIDGVEQEFLLRLHRQGLHTSVCRGLLLPHVIGQPRVVTFLGRRIETSDHAPFRRYYVWRNHLTWMKEYWRDEPEFCRADLHWLVVWTLRALLFEQQRPANIMAVVRGLRDFVLGRFGKASR